MRQSLLDKSISVQADVVRLQRRLPELGPKAAERYAAWARALCVAAEVYKSLAEEEMPWSTLRNTRRSTSNS